MMQPEIGRQLAQEQPGKLHQALLSLARRRIEAAERRWSQRHPAWRESEDLYRAFRVPDDQDEQTASDSLTQGVAKIVVPYSYAVIQATLAFLMATLTQRKPLIPVEGKGERDVRAAYLMEALLDHQANDMTPSLKLVWYQWMLDAFRYGVGVVKSIWTLEEWPEFIRTATPVLDPFGNVTGHAEQVSQRNVVRFEGNLQANVAPYDFLPDPSRSFADFQRGEYCIVRVRKSMTQLRQAEAQGLYVGVRDIPRQGSQAGYGAGYGSDGASDTARIMGMSDQTYTDDLDDRKHPYVALHEMWTYLDPAALGLTGGAVPAESYPMRPPPGTPELWVLTIANRARVLRAEPANLPAYRFPFEVIEVNYDWHSPANFGMIEVFRGLQYYYSWLFNSRMQAVRKTLNNESLINPSAIEELDLLDPEPGRLLRLKREFWDNPDAMNMAIKPLPVQDVTAGHMDNARIVQELIQVVGGAPNNVLGMVNSGRRAATEIQAQTKMASGRLQMLLEIMSDQGFKPLAHQMAKNTQVFLDLSNPIALREPWRSLLGMPYAQVTPEALDGSFQYPFTDQGMPTDRMFEGNAYKEMLTIGLQTGAAAPAFQAFPWPMLMARWLRAQGIKDLHSFGLSPMQLSVEPDQQVQNQVQQGNLVPQQQPEAPPTAVPSDGFALPPTASSPMTGNNGLNG